MSNIKKFYENTKNADVHFNVKKLLEIQKQQGKAIDLGCGAGRDTVFLLQNGWNVTAIDKEDVEGLIKEKLSKEKLKRFKFAKQEFENINLEKNNLLVANFSIPFCNKKNFNELWNKIKCSILLNGYFVGNFFGQNDEWNKVDKGNIFFLSKEEVLELFDDFKIIVFKDCEWDGKTGLGQMKHWHTYEVIAKKNP